MIPCEWKDRGCARMFQGIYSLRVHQRSCCYQRQPKRKKQKPHDASPNSTLLSNTHLRLRCDRETFLNSDNPILPLPQFEHDQDKVSDIIRALQTNDGIGKEKLSDEDQLITSTMLLMAKISRKAGRNFVDAIIKMIINPLLPVDKLRISCRSVMDCIRLEDEVVHKDLCGMGFRRKVIFNDDETVQCSIYLRSPIDVIANQILGASASSTMFNCERNSFGREHYCHPMNAALGMKGEETVKKAVMSNKNSHAMWHDSRDTSHQSFAGMVQLYSDKSRTSLKESSFQFYPLHVNMLNFSEQYRRHCIVEGMTVVAFLPIKFYSCGASDQFEINLPRPKYLHMLHKSISIVLDELKTFGLEGFACRDKDGINRVCHPVISSYCSDLPECKDILPVKNGNSSKRNCHRCMVDTQKFNEFTTAAPRDGNDTVSKIQEAKELRLAGRCDASDKLLDEYSLVDMVPFLHGFPFIGLDPVFDMHVIFSYEPLHNLYLGISKLLKVCLSERLKSTNLQTSAILSRGGKTRTTSFRNVRMTILTGINRMLSHIQRFSPVHGMRIDFSKGGSSGHEKGVYGPDGNLIGMLEGKNYRNLDIVFPFVGMFVDRLCDEVSTANSTKLFVHYIDMQQTCLSYKSATSVMWNEEEIIALKREICNFKKMARKLYGEFHASQLGTEKMHMLDHIPDDIRRLGGLRYCDAGLYEYSHTMVKSAHKATSRRRHSAMDETISTYVKDVTSPAMNGPNGGYGTGPVPKRSINYHRDIPKALASAIQDDCATLVSTGELINVSEIDYVRRLIRKKRIAIATNQDKVVEKLELLLRSRDKCTRDLVEDIGETAARILYKELLTNIFRGTGTSSIRSHSTSIVRVASGYVSGIQSPTSKHYVEMMSKVVLNDNSVRKSQRFVSTRGFYSTPGLRQDCVLLQAPGTSQTGKVNVWFAKLLGLFRAERIGAESSGHEETKYKEQYAFVQFFDVTPLEDETERALGCVRLMWARGSENCHAEDVGLEEEKERKWFTLVPASTIRGVTHIVRGDYGIENRCVRKDMEDVSWEHQHFYVNRFQFQND